MLENLIKLFSNYQDSKLNIVNPDLVNLLILLLFVVLILLSYRKTNSNSLDLLSIGQTEQLKGLAIFFVVLGHLWIHVSQSKAWFVLSGDAVSMFLMLSGFGLTMSTLHKRPNLKKFWYRRINRVMVPYWIATFLIVILDYAILRKSLSLDSFIMTLFGINVSIELRHLDYVRWFVTFILLWYLIFFLAHKVTHNSMTIFSFMLLCGFLLLPLNYYIFDLGWYQFFSFPIGYLLALYNERLQKTFHEKKQVCILISLIGLVYVLTYKFIMGNEITYSEVTKVVPTILLVYLRECNSLLLNCAIIFLSGYIYTKGFKSSLLQILGKYSYEIFLLHGAFLIKYNPILSDSGNFAVSVEFCVFLFFVAILSLILSKISIFVYLCLQLICMKRAEYLSNE